MNDLMIRASVGAQMRAATAREFIAGRLRGDRADNMPVGLIIAIIIGVIVLAGLSIGVFLIANRANDCMEGAAALTANSGAGLSC